MKYTLPVPLRCRAAQAKPAPRAGLMWKGFETYSQISFRNIFLVSLDWIRTKIFGRDISRV
jgi:NADH dehydrogenase FAD-containing subunit